MKIPNKVKIGGITYTVNTDVERFLLGDDMSGEILFRDAEISIRKGLEPQVAERTFIHEVLHGIHANLGYMNGGEEDKIDELAGALYALIVDNPGIFK